MGLFDWVKRALGGQAPEQAARASTAPSAPVQRFNVAGNCPYCGVRLRSPDAKQCFVCGVDWHDPSRVTKRDVSRDEAKEELTKRLGSVEEIKKRLASGIGTVVRQPTPAPKPWTQRSSSSLTGLDNNKFAPIARNDLLGAAQAFGRSLWSNPWFGRRDLIPPVNDPRTHLIDRAMVTHGLLAPEELEHIHEIGAEMDRVRPDIALANQRAEAAVKRTQAELDALKAQKKQEAAERKRKHVEVIAHRKQTDIVFLGRGVSRGLADRTSNAELLEQLGLPVLASPADVATAIGITIPRLRWLAYHNEAATRTHYIRFSVPKKSGGMRELAAPHRSLRQCQEWIFEHVLNKLPVHDAAQGFVRGRSTVTNASVHAAREVLVNTDLKDFFPSITFPRVAGMFRGLGYSPAVAAIFALLCTESPRQKVEYSGKTYYVATGPRTLPQGACTSPALSNRAARKLDIRLTALAERLGWTYTRYADDATFSATGTAANAIGYLLARVRHISQDEGFQVNESKTRILRRNTAQLVTGIVVNQHPAVPRKAVRRLRAILHRAKTEGLAAQNRGGHENFESWLAGMIAYVAMVHPDHGRRLQVQFAALQEREHRGD